MHGQVRCESEPGVGSRFIVSLPLVAWTPGVAGAARPAEVSRAPGRVASGAGHRVLLAEDHPINREVITRQLAKLGYACEWVPDGQEAWERLSAPGAAYALLLTDCHMPRLDGYELTQRLRSREQALGLARLPIVALTANALQGEAERCLALGMDAYLSKPLQLEALGRTLGEVLADRPRLAPAPSGGDADGRGAAQPYAQLMQLCNGNAAKVAKLVGLFVTTTEEDVKAMDRASEAGDPASLQKMAHRLCSACNQLDERNAVLAFRAVEHAEAQGETELLEATRRLYTVARRELEAVLSRASGFVRDHG
jgi:CheY-like chemotaxis protein